MEERRKWKRYSMPYPAEIESEGEAPVIYVANVSEGGVGYRTESEIKKNDKISLRLFLKRKMFIIKAAIVRVKALDKGGYDVGAEFIEIPETFRPILNSEIEEAVQLHRDNRFYKQRNISFENAFMEYLDEGTEKRKGGG